MAVDVQQNGASFADIVKEKNSTKPVFIKESDYFGSSKPTRSEWISHVELYKVISKYIPPETLVGLQRVKGLWRIYTDNEKSRSTILTEGLALRGRKLTVYDSNPNYAFDEENTVIRIKNVPLSADDGQIKRALVVRNVDIVNLYREKLRVEGRLTNCETGDRIAIVKKIVSHLPSTIEVGRYKAVISYRDQPTASQNSKCTKCLEIGHVSRNCPNDVKCKRCNNTGHIMSECKQGWPEESVSLNEQVTSSSELDSSSSDENSGDEDVMISDQENETDPTSASVAEQRELPVRTPSCDEHTSKKKKKKQRTKRGTKKDSKTSTINTIDKFLNQGKLTPSTSRKSRQMAAEVRTPPTPTEMLEAGGKAKKKPKDDNNNK